MDANGRLGMKFAVLFAGNCTRLFAIFRAKAIPKL